MRRAKRSNADVVIDPQATPPPAIEAVGAILQVLAETTARDGDAASLMQAWARHVLALAPPPGSSRADCSERDWAGMSGEVVTHVRADHAAVTRSIHELQDAVWLIVERLAQTVVGDSSADDEAVSQLARLRAAVDRGPAELKATALDTVARLSEIIDAKSSRQRALARELGDRVDVLMNELEATRQKADLDPLTQLCNHGVFQSEAARTVQVRALVDHSACLILVDVDGFKLVNDVRGHATGDAALQATADTLVRCFHRRGDVVARIGGDEFAVILHDATAADGERLAERLLVAMRAVQLEGEEDPLSLTVSVGVAEVLVGETADGWFTRADRALYGAKSAGRDRVVVADAASGESVTARAAA